MAVQKDECSSSPERASKLQLAVEPPPTGGHWNPPKRYSTYKEGEGAMR